MGKKGEKRGQKGKKWRAQRYPSWGGLSHCQTTSRLASLANLFFLANSELGFSPFSHNAEPGPRLSVIKTLWLYILALQAGRVLKKLNARQSQNVLES